MENSCWQQRGEGERAWGLGTVFFFWVETTILPDITCHALKLRHTLLLGDFMEDRAVTRLVSRILDRAFKDKL